MQSDPYDPQQVKIEDQRPDGALSAFFEKVRQAPGTFMEAISGPPRSMNHIIYDYLQDRHGGPGWADLQSAWRAERLRREALAQPLPNGMVGVINPVLGDRHAFGAGGMLVLGRQGHRGMPGGKR